MTTWDNVQQALQAYDPKREQDGEYRCNSPLRVGANSHSFHIKVDADGEHGTYYDHVSGDKGSLYDIADKLNVARVGVQTVEDTKRVYRGLDDYAAAHGVETWVFRAAGWKDEIEKKDGRDALVFWTGDYKRYRFIDGEKPKYKSAYGYKRSLYKLSEAVSLAKSAKLPLILCNGEPSVVTAQYFDLPATCLTAGEEGYKNFPPALIDQLKEAYQGEIIVALDCDKTGRESAEEAVKLLAAAGLKARAVDLGLSTGGDLGDLCKLHGEGVGEVVRKLPPLGGVKEAPPASLSMRKKRRIIHANDLKNLPPLTWLIEGKLLDNGLNMLYGESGIGKSMVALDWALELAQTMDVLYYALEGQSGYDQRCDAWCEAHHKTKGKLHFDIDDLDLMDADQVTWLIEDVQESGLKPKLIIFDTLAASMGQGDENSTQNANIVIANAKRVRAAFGCGILLIHHMAKGSKWERGSTVFRASMDCMVKLERDDDLIKVESAKIKDGKPFKPYALRMVDFGESATVLPSEKVLSGPGQPLTGQQRKVLDFLALEVFRMSGARSTQIKDDSGVTPGSLWRVLSELTFLNYVQRPPRKNEPYTITDLGRRMLAK